MTDLVERLRDEGERIAQFNLSHSADCYEAASALEAQEKRIAELSRDAQRYRWLRANLYAIDGEYGTPPQCAIVFKWRCDIPVGNGASLDAAIDAALAGREGKT